ncbi:MAG: hypothetical protein ACLFR2_01415 [Candidatus Kapaibacterium sp.]
MTRMHEPPFITELREEIEINKKELLQVLQQWHYKNTIDKQRISFLYDNKFGRLEDELKSRQLKASSLEKKLDMIRMKKKSGESLTASSSKFIESLLKRNSVRQPLRVQAPAPSSARPGNAQISDTRSEESKYHISKAPALYRRIVKTVHPDVSAESSLYSQYWDNIQDAWKEKDIRRLKLFHDLLCPCESQTGRESMELAGELKQELNSIRENIALEKNRIKELSYAEPFNLEQKLDDNFWVTRRKQNLKQKISSADRKIKHLEAMLAVHEKKTS